VPCNTITTQSVALAKAMPEIVAEAIKTCGGQISLLSQLPTAIQATIGNNRITWTAGKGITVQGYNNQEQIKTLTKAYSKQAVTWAAKRAGWTVKQTADDKLTVSRR
jgi:hypothetical protein